MRRRKLLRRLRIGRQAPSRPDIESNRTSQGEEVMGLVEEGGFEERGRRAYNCHTRSGTDDECNQDFH